MWTNIGLDKCYSFIDAGYTEKKEGTIPPATVRPVITISRMTGAGGHTVASHLAEYLQMATPSHDVWTIFDRNLVEKVLEEHRHQKRVAHFLEESHKTLIADVVEEWMGLHPNSWTLVQQTNATILHLAQMGNVIIVGRGASVVTRKLGSTFHVRLIGSLEKRAKQAERVFNLDPKSAQQFVKNEDEAHRRYLKDNFEKNIDDPLLYHVIINTDLVQYDEAARLIGDEVIRRFKLDSNVKAESQERKVL